MPFRILFYIWCTLLLFVAITGIASAQSAPTSIMYQGKLTDSTGIPVSDGSRAVVFGLYDAESAGNKVWDSGVLNVATTGGVFSVGLGAAPTPPITESVLSGGNIWLEITVGADPPLPRVKLHSAPFAIRASMAETVADNSITSAKIVDGAIQLADLGSNGASANQVIKRNSANTAWVVADDNDTTYSAGSGLSLAGTTFSLNSSYMGENYWAQGGNSGTSPGADYIGTSDSSALEFKVNSSRALRIEPTSSTPSWVGGYASNEVTSGVLGAFIGGGGNPDDTGSRKFNKVTDHFGTIGGGVGNTAGSNDSTLDNAKHATVAGGQYNEATATLSTVGGGWYNRASYERATVSGGWNNLASNHASTVGGGRDNTASGSTATVPGGQSNRAQGNYSFAAGQRAKADHQGAFVWADSTTADFISTANNQFLIRASGGVGINTSSPGTNGTLDVVGSANWSVYGRNGTSGPIGALASASYGVYGRSNSSRGVHGESALATGIGVHGVNTTSGYYGQLGGTDFGVASEGTVKISNGDLVISNGDLVISGSGQYRGNIGPNNGAPFPRPAYDSGWVSVAPGYSVTLTHNVGLTKDNYVVDMMFKDIDFTMGVHNYGLGAYLDNTGTWLRGAYYRNLTENTVELYRGGSDLFADQIRVRIWAYN